MNKNVRNLTLAIALSGASTGIASACCTPAPVCNESISCELHHAIGSVGVADTRSTQSAKASSATASVATPAEAPPHSGPAPSYGTIVKGELAQVTAYLQHLLGF